jgi:hypothetical protein
MVLVVVVVVVVLVVVVVVVVILVVVILVVVILVVASHAGEEAPAQAPVFGGPGLRGAAPCGRRTSRRGREQPPAATRRRPARPLTSEPADLPTSHAAGRLARQRALANAFGGAG